MTSIYLIKKGMAAGYVGVSDAFQPNENHKMLKVYIWDDFLNEMKPVSQIFPNEDLEEKSIETLAASFNRTAFVFNRTAFVLAEITKAMGKLND